MSNRSLVQVAWADGSDAALVLGPGNSVTAASLVED